jgi:L-amino acid N-acyltransferase YncA
VELDVMRPEETARVRQMLNDIITEGFTYPQEHPLSEEEFAAYWLRGDAFVVRTTEAPPQVDTAEAPGVIGGAFYLKPNFPGRCSHICNAGFIVPPEMRGRGIGRFMGEMMLAIAPQYSYRAVMFNLIFETNEPSYQLWRSLGFQELGRIPAAVRMGEDRYIDAIMMHRALV